MKSEELARVLFSARPLLWGIGIAVVIVAVVWAIEKLGPKLGAPANSQLE